jgi:hypothetical protein
VSEASALIHSGRDVEILVSGVRASFLRLSLPVVEFTCARAVDTTAGSEPSTGTYVIGTVLLSTVLSPFYRVLLQALSRRRRVECREVGGAYRVLVVA